MTEQTHKKYDLCALGRVIILELVLKWKEVLTDSGVFECQSEQKASVLIPGGTALSARVKEFQSRGV